MNLSDFKNINFPDGPGVYFFKKGDVTLYIGKATSLRERVRSYFNDDLIKTRGRLLIDMVVQADSMSYRETDSVLEAFILESELIKQYQPKYNTKEKDNKSFNYVVMTKEDFPRVLVVRGRNLEKAGISKKEQIENLGFEYTDVFGPFPFGTELREAMKLIRRIFPYRDKCEPFKFKDQILKGAVEGVKRNTHISSDGATIMNTYEKGKPCFNRSIGLCPGVCTGEISQEEYATQISHIRNFFKGKKQAVVEELKQQMSALAKEQKFEEASEVKKTIGALAHIHDISMIKKDAEFGYVGSRKNVSQNQEFSTRVEAYDVAHMSGKDMVGVMVVLQDGDFAKNQYKKFNIREIKASNDTGALKQMLERRFSHADWAFPTHIVLDGSVAQLNVAESVLKNIEQLSGVVLVAVTKDEKHKAKTILRSELFKGVSEVKNSGATLTDPIDDGDIISINQECHRFAIATHRKRRNLSRGL